MFRALELDFELFGGLLEDLGAFKVLETRKFRDKEASIRSREVEI